MIRYARVNATPIPFLNNWLTDFVFVPLVIHFSQVLVFALLGYARDRVYSIGHVLIFALYVGFFFEVIAPQITHYNTADYMDTIAYLAGAVFYKYIHLPYLQRKASVNRP